MLFHHFDSFEAISPAAELQAAFHAAESITHAASYDTFRQLAWADIICFLLMIF